MVRRLSILFLALFAGCSHFKETYHFKGFDPAVPTRVNYYRVEVDGRAHFGKSRYVSGFYDERAIDLFFNEIRRPSGGEANIQTIFVDEQKAPGSGEVIKPLSGEDGQFLMIFSTNAKVVADTIGQFAENQATADAITQLLNREELKRTRADLVAVEEISNGRASGTSLALRELVDGLPTSQTPGVNETREQCLRILSLVSRELGGTREFASLKDANTWLEAYVAGRKAQ